MNYKNRYSIGEVSLICNVSKKTLRYYDKIGLINSERDDTNNYRYYTKESLLAVPVIKYYKQMGFKLDEMREFIEGNHYNVYKAIQTSFRSKIDELQREQEEIRRKYASVKDWYDLIIEAEMVIDNNIHEVSIKYVEATDCLYQEQIFNNDIEASIINIEFTNHVEAVNNEITGPVMLNFSSFRDRMENKGQNIRILQRTLMECKKDEQMTFGGYMMVACYHIGPHESICGTYEKMCHWARRHGYLLGDESYERYVADYWTTRNSAQFVTEIMIRATRV
ncbi:MerR family transcriptional regulator [Desulfobotulus mexicanus]|uniref:MerR family transcriptional regulator n=1 Tax=Desulfobotulus mexicanus TaxID=2586642 RepID=A0A5S5MF30_9BACT|nr:MerR family transcriptional regulator [Desulfobotulus mexicanus]TYT74279.1 MerR family transcriptional regulator [Desulfobotulus mexicanus]